MGVNNGLRAGDLIRLKVKVVRGMKIGDTLTIKETKTGKENILVINKTVHKTLRNYLDAVQPDDEDFLFASRKGNSHIQSQAVSKALYPVMRRFGYFDTNFYRELEDLEISEEELGEMSYKEIYRDREYDFCEAEINIMVEYSGISRRSIQNALNDLHEKKLIEPLVNCYGWKVFLRPVHKYKRDFLNKEVMNSFRYSL
jgi:hypothetical protein